MSQLWHRFLYTIILPKIAYFKFYAHEIFIFSSWEKNIFLVRAIYLPHEENSIEPYLSQSDTCQNFSIQ